VARGQVFSEYFGFPCQYSFHQLLHNHHHLSSEAGSTKWTECHPIIKKKAKIQAQISENYRSQQVLCKHLHGQGRYCTNNRIKTQNSMERNWMKSVLDLTRLGQSSRKSLRRLTQETGVSFHICSFSKKETQRVNILWRCKE
jgi:hypothetical protein